MVDYASTPASVEPTGLPGRPYPRLPDEESPAATGIAIAHGLEDAGAVAAHVHQQQLDKEISAQHFDAVNQIHDVANDLTTNQQTGAFGRQGKNAFGLDDQYLPQFDQRAAAIVAAVPNARARQAASQAMLQIRNQFKEQLDSHEMEEHRKFDIQATTGAVKVAQQTAANGYNNAGIVHDARDSIDVAVTKLGQLHGWSDDQIQSAKQEEFSRMHTNVIDRMLADDKPQMAKHYLDTVKSDMEPNSAWAATKTIEAHVKQKENEAKADIAGRYQDSLLAAEAGLPNALTVSRGEMQLLYPKDGARRWDGLQSMVRAGAQAKAYDHMTPDEVDADLKSRAPTSGGPEVAFQLKAQEMLERAAEKSLRARVADPAQFTIQRGGWAPLNFSNAGDVGDELQRRAATAPQISAQVGVPVPLLTRQESHQLAGALDRATPNDAVDLLAQLHKSLPTENAFGSVLSQIAPHSPVMAVAASLMDVPRKADAPQWYDERFAADPKVASGILDGERILAGKGDKETGEGKPQGFKMPADKDLQGVYQGEIGGDRSNLFQGRPATADMYYDAFKSYYAHLAAQKGVTTGTIDRGMAQEATRAVIGDFTRYNHTDLVVPRGLDPSRFDDLVNKGVREAAKRAGYSDKEAESFMELGLRELGGQLGSGRYVLVDGNGRTLSSADKSGPVIVDLRKVTPDARKSHSFLDLFNTAGATEQ